MRILGDHVVFKNGHPHYRAAEATHPSVCWVGNDETSYLVCGFVVGQARTSADRRLHLLRSDDNGATWSEMPSPFTPLNDLPEAAHAGIVMGRTSAGTLILAAARLFMVPPESASWDDAMAGIVDADTVIARLSGDGTWTLPLIVDRRRHGAEWAIPCGVPVTTVDGTIVLPMERHTKSHIADWRRLYHAFALYSYDDGAAFAQDRPMLNDPEGRIAYYDQELAGFGDGQLLTIAWVHDVIEDRTLTARCAWSDDEGTSWSEPHDTGIEGGPVSPLLLPDGRLLAFYTRRLPPAGIRVCLSEDRGRTWRTREEFVIWDDEARRVTGEPAQDTSGEPDKAPLWGSMWGWTFGSPTPVLGHNDTVLVTFSCADHDGIRYVRCVELEY